MRVMLKAALGLAGVLLLASCRGGDPAPTPSSPTPTPPPCFGTPVPVDDTHDIALPRVGGDYTRQMPIDAYVDGGTGTHVNVSVVTLAGGLLGSVLLTASDETRGTLHRVEEILVMQAIPDKTRACAILKGRGWRAEIPVRVGGANP